MKIWLQRQWKILRLLWSAWIFLQGSMQNEMEASFGIDQKRNITVAMVVAKGIPARDVHAWLLEKTGNDEKYEKETT